MGSWNGTCGLSQLPIVAGTKVKVFLMLKTSADGIIGGSGVCYSTAHFRPWFLPVNAEYDDYGSITAIEDDWNSRYMLEKFQQWLKEKKVRILGDDAEINSPDITSFQTLKDVFDCVERGALVFCTHDSDYNHKTKKWRKYKVELRIGMFMVIESVFDRMYVEYTKEWQSKKNEYYQQQSATSRAKCIEALEKIHTVKEDEADSLVLYDMMFTMALGDAMEERVAIKHYKTLLYDKAKGVSFDTFLEKKKLIDAMSLIMSVLRKMWIPQSGQGSQCEELHYNRALAEAMIIHCDVREKELEAYGL